MSYSSFLVPCTQCEPHYIPRHIQAAIAVCDYGPYHWAMTTDLLPSVLADRYAAGQMIYDQKQFALYETPPADDQFPMVQILAKCMVLHQASLDLGLAPVHYLIQWGGSTIQEATWEPFCNVPMDAIADYNAAGPNICKNSFDRLLNTY